MQLLPTYWRRVCHPFQLENKQKWRYKILNNWHLNLGQWITMLRPLRFSISHFWYLNKKEKGWETNLAFQVLEPISINQHIVTKFSVFLNLRENLLQIPNLHLDHSSIILIIKYFITPNTKELGLELIKEQHSIQNMRVLALPITVTMVKLAQEDISNF